MKTALVYVDIFFPSDVEEICLFRLTYGKSSMHSSYFLSNFAEFEFYELDLESSEVSGRIIAIGLVARVLMYNIISVKINGDQFAIENMFGFL